MKGVILQPSYIPWRGFFDQIYKADLFIFYDDVQYDKHGWRNRNRIKTRQGGQWLTIPVHSKGIVVEDIPINQIAIAWEQPWSDRHWRAIQQNYRKAPYFKLYAPWLEAIFQRRPELLADFTIPLTIEIAQKLGISHSRFLRSSELTVSGRKTDRLISILTQLGIDHYISGPSASSNIENDKFQAAGIALEYMVYDYPAYPQLLVLGGSQALSRSSAGPKDRTSRRRSRSAAGRELEDARPALAAPRSRAPLSRSAP